MLKKVGGAALTAASLVLLYALASPWSDLGGLVSERLRWAESFVLYVGAIVGFTLASELRVRRRVAALLYPAGLVTATLVTALQLAGVTDVIGVVTTAFASYLSGVVFALWGLPWLSAPAKPVVTPVTIRRSRSPPGRARRR